MAKTNIRIVKTWQEVKITASKDGVKQTVDLSLNFVSKEYSISEGTEANSVSFDNEDIDIAMLRAEAVTSALRYVKKNLFNK